GHTGGERETPASAFERGEADLERGARGVARPGVLVALVLPNGFLRERRRLENRDDDRAGHPFGLLTGMDGERLEAGPSGSFLHARGARPSAGERRTRAGPPS